METGKFQIEGDKLIKCERTHGTIRVPYGVKEIGAYAFEDCEELQELMLPGGVSRVGEEAFAGCKNLARVVIPDGIKELEYDSFAFYAHNPEYMLLPKRYEPT